MKGKNRDRKLEVRKENGICVFGGGTLRKETITTGRGRERKVKGNGKSENLKIRKENAMYMFGGERYEGRLC